MNTARSPQGKSAIDKPSGRRGPGRPPDSDRARRRREDILGVATELFAEKGYQTTDVQEIADRLSVAKGTIYHYFPSKEALFLAAVDKGMAGLSKEINGSIIEVDDPIKQISTAIRAFLGYFDQHPEIVELIVQERAEFRDRKKPTYLIHREKNIKPWNDLFATLAKDGRFRDLEAEETTQTISNLLYGTIFTTYFARKGRTFESRAQQVLLMVFAGLLSDRERANLDDYISV